MPKQRQKRLRSDSEGEQPVTGDPQDQDERPVEPAAPPAEHGGNDHLSRLSLEVLCRILSYLPLKDLVKMDQLSRKLQEAVTMHLRLITQIDFTEGTIYGWMPTTFNDETFGSFLKRCPGVVSIYGMHLRNLSKRRQRGCDVLSVPGIISALTHCEKLRGVETSDIFLLEALLTYLPHIEILGMFKNRGGAFPMLPQNKILLNRSPKLTSLYLTGVTINDLPRMEHLKHLYLKWTKLTDPAPFKDFGVPLLRSFVMTNCAGPTNALKYVPMVTALAGARLLTRLELVRVPFLGGLMQHVVEDSWRVHGFRQLHKIVFGTCKYALEPDLGYLMITAANRLGEVAVQPSLTKDSLFSSLVISGVDFAMFETLHLGFVDDFPAPDGKWTNEELVKHGLADVNENPAMMTDIGMNAVGQVFSNLRNLIVYNCPHLHLPTAWFTPNGGNWIHLRELHLRRCHGIRLKEFCQALPKMLNLESLILEQMFREPPKGCSRVGLSAGTGLGVSSALVQNTGQDTANADGGNNNNNTAAAAANVGPANNAAAAPDDGAVNNNAGGANDVEVVAPQVEGQHGVVPGPGHQAPVPNVGDDMEVEAIENDALNDDHDKAYAVHKNVKTKEESNKNVGNSTGYGSGRDPKPCCSCDCHKSMKSPTPGGSKSDETGSGSKGGEPTPESSGVCTASGMLLRSRHSVGVGTPRRDEPRRTDRDTGEVESNESSNPAVFKSSSSHSKRRKPPHGEQKVTETTPEVKPPDTSVSTAVQTGCSENKSSESSTSERSDREGSSSPGGRTGAEKEAYASSLGLETKLRRSARLSKGQAASEDVPTTKSPVTTQGSPAVSAVSVASTSSGGGSSASPEEPSQRKGKSWYGRKKGIMKKHGAHHRMNQSCQAVSEEIRETTKKAKEAEEAAKTTETQSKATEERKQGGRTSKLKKPAANSSSTFTPIKPDSSPESGWTSCGWGAHMGTRSRAAQKRKPNTRNQATSTSDPVIEDDHEQELVIRSRTLMNLTLRQVGVTDLSIQNCPSLQMLSGTKCRVLKRVTVRQSPRLHRVNFAQCAKLRYEKMIDEVCSSPPERSRLIVVRPMRHYDANAVEKMLFGSSKLDCHVCLVHDHSNRPEDTVQNRTRMSAWLSTLASINSDLSKMLEFPTNSRQSGKQQKYPWGRNIYRMQGLNDLGHRWDMSSDLPWLRTLTTANRHPMSYACNSVHQAEDDRNGSLSGLCQEVLQEIAEYKEDRRVLYPHSLFVYVNLCDTDGIPTDDEYI